jgi:hypothetical protein
MWIQGSEEVFIEPVPVRMDIIGSELRGLRPDKCPPDTHACSHWKQIRSMLDSSSAGKLTMNREERSSKVSARDNSAVVGFAVVVVVDVIVSVSCVPNAHD